MSVLWACLWIVKIGEICRVKSLLVMFLALLFECSQASLFLSLTALIISIQSLQKGVLTGWNDSCSSANILCLDLFIFLIVVRAVPLMQINSVSWFPFFAVHALLSLVGRTRSWCQSAVVRGMDCAWSSCGSNLSIVIESRLSTVWSCLLLLLVCDHYLCKVCPKLALTDHLWPLCILENLVSCSWGYDSILTQASKGLSFVVDNLGLLLDL